MSDEREPLPGGALYWTSVELRWPEAAARWDQDGGNDWVGTRQGPWPHLTWDGNDELVVVAYDEATQSYSFALWTGDGDAQGWRFQNDGERHPLLDILRRPRKCLEKSHPDLMIKVTESDLACVGTVTEIVE